MILHWKSYLIKEEKKKKKRKTKKQNFHTSGTEKLGRHICKKNIQFTAFPSPFEGITLNSRKMYKFSLSSEIFHHPPVGSDY